MKYCLHIASSDAYAMCDTWLLECATHFSWTCMHSIYTKIFISYVWSSLSLCDKENNNYGCKKIEGKRGVNIFLNEENILLARIEPRDFGTAGSYVADTGHLGLKWQQLL